VKAKNKGAHVFGSNSGNGQEKTLAIINGDLESGLIKIGVKQGRKRRGNPGNNSVGVIGVDCGGIDQR